MYATQTPTIFKPSYRVASGISLPDNPVLNNFGFTEHPFTNAPDSRYLYLSKDRLGVQNDLMEIIEDRSGYTIVMGDKGSGNTTLAIRTKFKLNGFKNHNPLYISINNLFDKVDFWQLLVWHCHLDEKKRPSLNNVSFVQIEGKVL